MSASRYVYLDDCAVKKVTDKAVLVEYDDAEFWPPLSQVSDAGDLREGADGVTVGITEWIAKQKGPDAG